MQSHTDMIRNAEVELARMVALAFTVKRPVTAWHALIPGMFLFNFLRKTSETRRYTKVFMVPRDRALQVALAVREGGDRQVALDRASREIADWLDSVGYFSPEIHQAHVNMIGLLAKHYERLISSGGVSYEDLTRRAYESRQEYEQWLERLCAVEREIDDAISSRPGTTEAVKNRLRTEQEQLAILRKKITARIFPETHQDE